MSRAAAENSAAANDSNSSTGPRPQRPDLLGVARRKLGFWERFNLRIVRASFSPGLMDRLMRLCQRTVGQAWIHYSTRNLREVHGLERVGELSDGESILVVSNHRSFFDLYVITADLVRRGLKKRIIFPVRSGFFYDSPLGLVVNFLMSFLAMYPPIFRKKKKAAMNLLALDELSWLLAQGGYFAGLHPEGTRNRDSDPYTFLPAQPGVGRVVYQSRVKVVPAFVNGLSNDLTRQVTGNFNGRGEKVLVVFGEPIDFSDLLDQKASPRVFRAMAERCLEHIGQLGEEEKSLRNSN